MHYLTYHQQEYDAFSSHVRRFNSSHNEDKFHVLLRILSSMDIPEELYEGRFLSVDKLQTKSSALQLSKTRRYTKYNTVFGYCEKVLKCQIVTRTPDCIFNGLQEIFVTLHPLRVFQCQSDRRGHWKYKYCKYLGERFGFFKLNKDTNRLRFYQLSLKIPPQNVAIHGNKCKCRHCFQFTK